MVMQHYLDEELFINKDEVAVAYLRIGPKAQELFSGNAKVILNFVIFLPRDVLTYFCLKVKFAIQKKESGKALEQQSTATSSTTERDDEWEELEQECYVELVACCRQIASDTGVNYTSIMNQQVCLLYFNKTIVCIILSFFSGAKRNGKTSPE